MFYDVGESIREMLRTRGGLGPTIDILFDAPTKDWAARRSGPAIDVFLYDIRENLDRRQALLEDVREGDIVTGRRPPTRWFNCSYLITAWTQRPDDEHRLLGGLLSGLVATHVVPPDCLRGALATMERSVFLTVGRPLGSERSISDIWSALGGELKPSLDLVVVVPIEPVVMLPVGPPVFEAPSLFVGDGTRRRAGDDLRTNDQRTDDLHADDTRADEKPKGRRAAGKSSAGSGSPVAGGSRRSPGFRRAKGGLDDAVTPGADAVVAEPAVEELVGGSEDIPGRRFRFAVHEPPKPGRPGRQGGSAGSGRPRP